MRVSLFGQDHLGKRHLFRSGGLIGGYYLTGNPNGPPVIVLHGLTGNHIGMLPLTAHLNKYRCILLDLPGHASSPIPPPGTDMQKIASWFLEFVNLWEGAIVIAHSYGGTLALLALSKAPSVAGGCILLNPVALTSGIARVYEQVLKLLRPGLSAALLDVEPIKHRRQTYLLERSTPEVLQIMQQLKLAEGHIKTSSEQMAYFQKLGRYFDNPAIFKDVPEYLAAKTYCVVASHDSLASSTNTNFLQKLFGKRRVRVCKNSGHLMPIEAIGDTARIVNKILKRITKPTARFKVGLAGQPKP